VPSGELIKTHLSLCVTYLRDFTFSLLPPQVVHKFRVIKRNVRSAISATSAFRVTMSHVTSRWSENRTPFVNYCSSVHYFQQLFEHGSLPFTSDGCLIIFNLSCYV